MTELEKLERRLERWRMATGPAFVMFNREKAMREIQDQIAKLKAQQN